MEVAVLRTTMFDAPSEERVPLPLPASRWAEAYAKRMAMLFGGVYLLARAYNSRKDSEVA